MYHICTTQIIVGPNSDFHGTKKGSQLFIISYLRKSPNPIVGLALDVMTLSRRARFVAAAIIQID